MVGAVMVSHDRVVPQALSPNLAQPPETGEGADYLEVSLEDLWEGWR